VTVTYNPTTLVAGKYPYGTLVDLECDTDHYTSTKLQNSFNVACSGGTWEGRTVAPECNKKCLTSAFPTVANADVTNSPLLDLWHLEELNYECDVDNQGYLNMFANGEPSKITCNDGSLDAAALVCYRMCNSDDFRLFHVTGMTSVPDLGGAPFLIDHEDTVTYTCPDGSTPTNTPVRTCINGEVQPPFELPGGFTDRPMC